MATNSKTPDAESTVENPVVDTAEVIDTPLEILKKKYKYFEFRNISNTPKHLVLVDGDSAQINPNKLSKIESSKIIQLPSRVWAEIIVPTIEDLQEVGLIKVNTVTG